MTKAKSARTAARNLITNDDVAFLLGVAYWFQHSTEAQPKLARRLRKIVKKLL